MKINRSIVFYLFFTVGIYIFNKIYALFSHGVSSLWMSNAYLYLLGFGVGVFSIIKIFFSNIEHSKKFPLFYITYNSGVAVLINGMLLLGIIDIAGGASAFAIWYVYIGCAAILAAAILFFYLVLKDSLVREK